MKHHPIIKTIAIALCAAALLGIAASGLGMMVLTEKDLYRKTVDQVLTSEQRSWAEGYAHNQALRYASANLGGCSPELREQMYGTFWIGGSFAPERYGFTLLDGEGNPVAGINSEMKDTAVVYSVPVSGQYIYMVSETPMSVKYPTKSTESLHSLPTVLVEEGTYDNLPQGEEWMVYGISAHYADGNQEGMNSTLPIGALGRDENGRMVFTSLEPMVLEDVGNGDTLTYICFWNINNEVLYEASNIDGVGKAFYEPGDLLTFVSSAPGQVNGQEETQPQDNAIHRVEFYSAEDPEQVSFTVYSDENLGTLWYDETGVLMLSLRSIQDTGVHSSGTIAGGPVSGLGVYNSDGFQLHHYQGPGTVAIDPETLFIRFQSQPETAAGEEAAPQETEAEEKEEAKEEPKEKKTKEAKAETTPAETVPETIPETIPETVPETEPILVGGRLLSEYETNHTVYFSPQYGEEVYAEYIYTPLPEYTVEVYFSQELQNGEMVSLLWAIQSCREALLPILGVCTLAFMILAVYLCFAAGRGPGVDVPRAGGLNRLPLELYFLGAGTIAVAAVALSMEGLPYLLRQSLRLGCGLVGGMGYLASLSIVGFLFALVAQWKTPGSFWWHNSLCGWCCRLCWKVLKWSKGFLMGTCIPLSIRLVKWMWKKTIGLVTGFFRGLGKLIWRFMDLLPMTWQWMVVLFLLMGFITIAAAAGSGVLMLLCMAAALALALYVAHCFGGLLESTKRMRQGELDHKIDDRLMVGCFQDFAQELNQLADVAVVAAQKQLKSERMKSELITNVSHDIKTPLTSIINYVDLLQKPHTLEEEAIYLEVLERQSLSLKKLIEDLMDMSKASTGNMAVETMVLDAVEAVNQALGEYADKLEKAMIYPVFRHSETVALMVADGRLTWRVMGNLLNNAVKYAMPGTRLYIDLMAMETEVVISLKNISRDQLNVDAEELMERFVRGDDSRNTEGSGLGLNIAKSLMELQKGRLELLVDGDLFKVTLVFPAA